MQNQQNRIDFIVKGCASTAKIDCGRYNYTGNNWGHSKIPGSWTVRVEHFEVFLISRFSWVADDTKLIQVEGGITTSKIF